MKWLSSTTADVSIPEEGDGMLSQGDEMRRRRMVNRRLRVDDKVSNIRQKLRNLKNLLHHVNLSAFSQCLFFFQCKKTHLMICHDL